MLRIEMLPGGRGDCLWIEYGELPHKILVDGGTARTGTVLRNRILALPEEKRRFELLVVTHIDEDHIGGIVDLLAKPPAGLTIGDIWFNGRVHLGNASRPNESTDFLSVRNGIDLKEVINLTGLQWNKAFNHGPVVVTNPDNLPVVSLRGGIRLTVVGPTSNRLDRLRNHWDSEWNQTHGSRKQMVNYLASSRLNIPQLAAEKSPTDQSIPNGSSISLLAEYDGKRLLLTGDAYPSDLLVSVQKLATAEGEKRLRVDALKLSHHGGRGNTNREFLESIACKNYLISTDGTVFKHPHPESIAKVIIHGRCNGAPSIWFNYLSQETRRWNDAQYYSANKQTYEPHYPQEGGEGILFEA